MGFDSRTHPLSRSRSLPSKGKAPGSIRETIGFEVHTGDHPACAGGVVVRKHPLGKGGRIGFESRREHL